jgi:hypothetical protein
MILVSEAVGESFSAQRPRTRVFRKELIEDGLVQRFRSCDASAGWFET